MGFKCFMKKSVDVYECVEEAYTGSLNCNLLNCDNFVIYGHLVVRGLATLKTLVLVGKGYINILACSKVLMISYGGPIVLNNLACEKAILIGGRYPIVAHSARVIELYTTNSIFGELTAGTIYAGKRVGTKKLRKVREMIFLDPHTWVEELDELPASMRFMYEVV